jgi:hypothetical protein
MKKLRIFLLIAIFALIMVSAGCKKPHEHNYIDGVCECGDVIEVKYTVTKLDHLVESEKFKFNDFLIVREEE